MNWKLMYSIFFIVDKKYAVRMWHANKIMLQVLVPGPVLGHPVLFVLGPEIILTRLGVNYNFIKRNSEEGY